MKLKLFFLAIIATLLISASSYAQQVRRYTFHKRCYYQRGKPGKTRVTYHYYHWHTTYKVPPRRH